MIQASFKEWVDNRHRIYTSDYYKDNMYNDLVDLGIADSTKSLTDWLKLSDVPTIQYYALEALLDLGGLSPSG